MNKQKVFVTRSRVPKAIKLLEENFDVSVWNSLIKAPKDDLKKYIKDADAILTEVDDVIDKEIISNAPNLKIISNRAIGVDNIDIETANINNIKIGNTPGVLHESCADLTFGLIIAIARQIPYAYNQVLKGNWKFFDQTPYIGPDVYGSTLGIIGFGKIGQALAKRAQGFDMNVLYYSRSRKDELEPKLNVKWTPNLNNLLKESDYVCVLVPLSKNTEHIISVDELNLMKKSAYLINTSRGKTVDQKALINALESNSIAGAALDVTDPEPIEMDSKLLSMQNVLIVPHISSASTKTIENMGLMAAKNIILGLTGKEMLSCINEDKTK
ncbi:MAG: D-glycerate dehydrogenase [SAR202 cluster bacterium]|jgi:glyoxylate reductase|nr:D-glycerate dehydrogenase [SAR202 cluster bacterium]